MPEICRFRGMVIQMYYSDHEPPHFHVRCGPAKARFAIWSGQLLDGVLSPRHFRLARRWASLHRVKLLQNWERLRQDRPPLTIAPLE